MNDIHKKTALALLNGYKKKEFLPLDIVREYVKCIEEQNPTLNAFLEVQKERVLSEASQLNKLLLQASNPDELIETYPLFGVPIAIKDNILVHNYRATAGSQILKNYQAPYDATVIERLKKAKALIIGKTNCDEFAMGSSNENSAFGPVKNPWDPQYVAGGSSGGSAAAVSAGMCPLALGTDTGGSVRQPASLCGIYGLKPTYGSVSRYGVISYASSLEQVGPFAKTTEDLSRCFHVLSGWDPLDATSCTMKSQQFQKAHPSLHAYKTLQGMKIGVDWTWVEGLRKDVDKNFIKVIEFLKSMHIEIVDLDMKHIKHSLSVYYILAPSEASSNLLRYDGIHYGARYGLTEKGSSNVDGTQDSYTKMGNTLTLDEVYEKTRGTFLGKEVKLRIMLGTYALSEGYYDKFYGKALHVRNLIRKDFLDAFSKVDCILCPSSPTEAFRLGEKKDPLSMYLSDIFTIPINLAGLPALSSPMGRGEHGLPLGLQMIAPWFCEDRLFELSNFLARHAIFEEEEL